MDKIIKLPWTKIYAVILFTASLVFIAAEMSGQHTILDSVGNIEVARGLITFLIASATVAIALILVVSPFFGSGTEFKERFTSGKEVLAILIGVLGTIVGFYYGSTPASKGELQTFSTSPIVISNEKPKNGETITVLGLVTGGTPPYTYSVTFNPNNIIKDIPPVASTDGVIRQSISISTSISSDTDVTLKIDVTDSVGKTNTIGSKKITVKP